MKVFNKLDFSPFLRVLLVYLSYHVFDWYKHRISMLCIKVPSELPTGVMARSSPCNLDILSEMSGNRFALYWGGEWVYAPAPKIWMRGQ